MSVSLMDLLTLTTSFFGYCLGKEEFCKIGYLQKIYQCFGSFSDCFSCLDWIRGTGSSFYLYILLQPALLAVYRTAYAELVCVYKVSIC